MRFFNPKECRSKIRVGVRTTSRGPGPDSFFFAQSFFLLPPYKETDALPLLELPIKLLIPIVDDGALSDGRLHGHAPLPPVYMKEMMVSLFSLR